MSLVRKSIVLLMLISCTVAAQELTVDLGNGKCQQGWENIQNNNSKTFSNAFGPKKHATLSVKGSSWKRNSEQIGGSLASSSNLLNDYCGAKRSGTCGIKLELPAGLYQITLYHHQSSATRVSAAMLTLKDAAGEQKKAIKSGFGKAPNLNEVRHIFPVESNGSEPITFIYKNQSLGSAEFPINGIKITSDTPEVYTGNFKYNGKTHEYHVEKVNIRAPNFSMEAHVGPNEYEAYDVGLVRTYMGYVKDHPSMMIAGYLRPDGDFRGGVYWDRFARRLEFVGEEVLHVEMLDYPQTFDEPRRQFMQAGRMDKGTHEFNVGIEIPYDQFSEKLNSDLKQTLESVEFSAVQVSAIYLRDAEFLQKIAHVLVRTSEVDDPYLDVKEKERTLMTKLWTNPKAHLSSIDFDKLLFVGGSSATLGGLTAATIIPKTPPPRMDLVWRHEMMHTFNPRNDEGGYPEGGTIMVRYRVMNRMSSTEMEAVVNYRDKTPEIFDILNTFDTPIPPYGNYDFIRVIKGSKKPVLLDVLANDHDVNGDPLSIKSFDQKSLFGATIKPVKGKDAQSNKLMYYPPAHKTGIDYFFYTITDGLFEFKAVVVIDVQPPHQIYEAEKATYKGKKKMDGSFNTGAGYIVLNPGQSITWTIESDKARKGLKFRYGSVIPETIPIDLYINEKLRGTLEAYPTGKRAEWRHIVLPNIELKPGKNRIRLRSRAFEDMPINVDHLMVHDDIDIRVNFSGDLTKESADLAWNGSYCHDWGRAFGDRVLGSLRYGWDTDVNDWEISNINLIASKDTGSSIAMQKKKMKRTWEIELPNGEYQVTIMCGAADPELQNHINHIMVEDTSFRDPDGKDQFDLYTGKITVKDGRLTVKPGSKAVNARICYIWIAQ